ncbi:MAG: hypothetical protein LBU55_03255 [Elusimicrobiota bacterium]|jgi:hypothetical protein|nr:hypothetical protein [Elusimicrobiota bacterium]
MTTSKRIEEKLAKTLSIFGPICIIKNLEKGINPDVKARVEIDMLIEGIKILILCRSELLVFIP